MVRFKQRYLLVEYIFPNELSTPIIITESGLMNLLRESFFINFGSINSGLLSSSGTTSIKYLSNQNHYFILKTSRQTYRLIWSALTLLRKLNSHQIIFKVLKVSGTIRKIQYATIHLNKRLILANAVVVVATATATEEEREAIILQQLEQSEQQIMAIEA